MAVSQTQTESKPSKPSEVESVPLQRTPPVCKKCGNKHWPFRLCPAAVKKIETAVPEKPPLSETVQAAVSAVTDRFVPTCRSCGKKHWPLDPSCPGAKGAKAEAKAKAKAEALAKAKARAEARVRAKAERIARARLETEEETDSQPHTSVEVEPKPQQETDAETAAQLRALQLAAIEAQARADAEAKARALAEARARAEHKHRIEAETRARAEAQARAQAQERAQAEAQAKAKARQQLQAATKMTTISGSGPLFTTCASDIMQEKIVWGDPGETVQQALAKIQQQGVDYIMVGSDGVLEGIISKSDLGAAISPYLSPKFSKWRRPMDDATLQIRLKWIMSGPVRTIIPETPLAEIIQKMRRFDRQCLPVVDTNGEVHGMVTSLDIFKALLQLKDASSTEPKGRSAHAAKSK